MKKLGTTVKKFSQDQKKICNDFSETTNFAMMTLMKENLAGILSRVNELTKLRDENKTYCYLSDNPYRGHEFVLLKTFHTISVQNRLS